MSSPSCSDNKPRRGRWFLRHVPLPASEPPSVFFFTSFVLLGLQCLLPFLVTIIMSSMTNTASLVIGKGPVERNDSALQLLQPGVTITTRQHIIVENRE